MVNVLIVGATRGLGAALANAYAKDSSNTVFGTTRSPAGPGHEKHHKTITWVPNVDLMSSGVGDSLVNQMHMLGVSGGMVEGGVKHLDVVVVSAGFFATEDFVTGPSWDDAVKTYTTSSIAPPCIIYALYRAHLLHKGSKILLISSESGSITLRHDKEGGGNYAHHGSKAALNMVGKLLSLDLKEAGVVVSIVHPGFMRTEMTKGVGFDEFWDEGGAVTPEEAAETLVKWVEGLGMDKSGEYWAPRGPKDIGTAEVTMGKNLPTPLQLPW